jgi:hypothetical protein
MTDSQDYLLVEYQAAQDTYLHHDSLPWQVGGLLIAGVFVFWGFILDKSANPTTIAWASLLVTALMSTWVLYAHQVRQIYRCKLDRIQEIERQLGMEQHRRFDKGDNTVKHYRYFGPSGFHLNLAIYTIASLGGLLLGYTQSGWDATFILPIALFAVIFAWVLINERRLNSLLKKYAESRTGK